MNPKRYFEFEAAPTGEWVDLGIIIATSGKETDWNFQSGMSVAARVQRGQVTIGMRIPWSERIPQPQRGKEWRGNLFSCLCAGKTTTSMSSLSTPTSPP